MAAFFQRGGGWVLGQFVFMLAVAALGIITRDASKSRLCLPGGLVFFAASAICGGAGLVSLGRNLTPFPKPAAGARLVQRGIYGLIRHPLYTAVICGAMGWWLFWQSRLALAASLVLAIYLDAKARHEERWLRQHFPDYANYQRRVKRFVPWIY